MSSLSCQIPFQHPLTQNTVRGTYNGLSGDVNIYTCNVHSDITSDHWAWSQVCSVAPVATPKWCQGVHYTHLLTDHRLHPHYTTMSFLSVVISEIPLLNCTYELSFTRCLGGQNQAQSCSCCLKLIRQHRDHHSHWDSSSGNHECQCKNIVPVHQADVELFHWINENFALLCL